MNALLSGSKGLLSLIDGDSAELHWVSGLTEKSSAEKATRLFRGANDTIWLENCSKNDALIVLEEQWTKDRALFLFLMLFDEDITEDETRYLQSTLDRHFCVQGVFEYVRSVLCYKPIPLNSINVISEKCPDIDSHTGKLVKELLESQAQISNIRDTWEKVSQSIPIQNCEEYEKYLISIGAFYRLVNPTKTALQTLRFDCIDQLKHLDNYRDIVSSFLSPFFDLCEEISDIKQDSFLFDNVQEDIEKQKSKVTNNVNPKEKREHAVERLDTANTFFKNGEKEKGIKVIDWLINAQLKEGAHEHAAKSLTHASEITKSLGFYDLQLGYARRAVEMNPEDSRAKSHLGEAYLNNEDYDLAEEIFKTLYDQGNVYSGTALVRIYRQKEQLQEALQLSIEVLDRDSKTALNWITTGDLYRDLKQPREAINILKEAKGRFPDNTVIACSLAAANADNHDYEQAMDLYDEAMIFFPNKPVAYTSKGHMLAKFGLLQEALPLLQKGVELSEDKEVAIHALASAYRMNGKIGKAINILKEAIRTYPAVEAFRVLLIDILCKSGIYKEASDLLESSIDKFGDTELLRIQRSNLALIRGEHRSSLEILDKLLDENPNMSDAWALKIEQLRKMKKYGEAAQEYKKATIHVSASSILNEGLLLGLVEAKDEIALKRLENTYLTIEDWDYEHACGVSLIRNEKAKPACEIVRSGVKRAPVRAQRKKFKLVFAIAKDFMGQTGSMIRAIKGYIGFEANIIRAIAYWKLGLSDSLNRMIQALKADEQNNKVISDFLKLVKIEYSEQINNQDLYELEKEIILLAA